ncbi:DEAD/DEAH box helicase [Sphingobacterium alkalisoli]|uniref:DEAD-box ATP-dependent RNA helicase RhpA n=1 Tax=Sphingobacterium alkalisoli TaxID=1874115 RepID=A0A4U0H566_9SPHI|nr:DEAD/DEAH box helicase [Sphingobacterium alkalisoli]TJY66840.1 DEAD/DEAH box helicase [Sphingobacterium alkalisoli]GGH13916.1 DEAD/DEAH box family ATP-dependent RNA helicase [Sphingobacterium alkalisoli]
MTTFKDLKVSAPILAALDTLGYKTPTPIQAQAIPDVLNGKDLLGCAQTGTGKTAAFAIPILQLLNNTKPQGQKRGTIRALILTPTRELAIQIDESFQEYGKNLKLKHAVIFGGVNQFSQVNQIKAGVDILVATPGRLLDLMNQKVLSIHQIEIFVLDEADRMLDMGFIHDVKKVLQVIPQRRQTLFFSATMPKTIQALADSILHNPVKVEVTPESTTAETIQQTLYYVEKANKNKALLQLLKNDVHDSVLVFTRTKHGADKLVKVLFKYEISSAAIHGNKSQNQRQRALEDFKNKKIKVLVATDIAARGIDIDLLKYVINYEIPNVPESYVHRIGRSGRAGAEGFAISLCDVEEIPYVQDIEKTIGIALPVMEIEGLTMSPGFVAKSSVSVKAGKGGKGKAAAPATGRPENRYRKSKPTSKERRRRQA